MSAVLKLVLTRMLLSFERWRGEGLEARYRAAEKRSGRRALACTNNSARRVALSQSFMDQAKELSRKTP